MRAKRGWGGGEGWGVKQEFFFNQPLFPPPPFPSPSSATSETWRSGVLIKKCRYLEASGCVGLCVNLCKRPTEAFFADAFGLPLTMVPNFEDLSVRQGEGGGGG